MTRIVLDYDETSGNLYDSTGVCITTFFGIVPFDKESEEGSSDSLDKLTKLRSMNLSVEDIKELRELDLL